MAYAFVILPFFALILANLLPRRARAPVAFGLTFALFLAQAAAALVLLVSRAGGLAEAGAVAPSGSPGAGLEALLGFHLRLDLWSLVAILSAGVVGAGVLPVAWSTMRDEGRRLTFASLLLINLMGIDGVALVTDLFSLYVFIEIVSISTYVLIAMGGEAQAIEGGFKYLVLSGVATVLLLAGIALLTLTEGDLSFTSLARAAGKGGGIGRMGVILFAAGLLTKGGFVPFHWWVPDAYTGAPTAVSALMAGIATKASGTFGIVRVVLALSQGGGAIREALIGVGILSIVVGAFAGLAQRDAKRMLAYSSVSQVGYIVAGLAAGNLLGLLGAALHFFSHAVCTSQLFGNVASLERATGSSGLARSGGLGKGMPITAGTSVLASLSIAGLPPLSGFWSKLLVVIALWQTGHQGYAVTAVVASLLTLAYFIGWHRRTFWANADPAVRPAVEGGAAFLLPAIALSVVNVGIGLGSPFIIGLFVR